MDRRTRILAGLLGLAVAYGLFTKVAYPRFIEPWLALDERIAEKEDELARLNALEERFNEARYEYRELVGRVGFFELPYVVSDVRDRLNKLVADHGLQSFKGTQSRPQKDRKTGLESAVVTVSATGTLRSAIEFMRDAVELPHLVRIGNVALTPASRSARRSGIDDAINLRVPIEVWVLPQQRVVGRIEPEELVHPELYVRHEGRDYSLIWAGEPFSDYVPLAVHTVPSYSVQTGAPLALEVTATGGRGKHSFQWTPSDRLSDPTGPRPRVDTRSPGTERYTVTVTDAGGHSAEARVSVTIREPPKPPPKVVETDPPPREPPPPPRDKPWPDGQYKELRMALLRKTDSAQLRELMVCDTRSRTSAYYGVGDDLDGGQLVFVHQTGGVVRRNDEYFVYPLGMNLRQSVPAASAADFPELQRAADYYRDGGEPLPLSTGADAGSGSDLPPGAPKDAGALPKGPAGRDRLASHKRDRGASEASGEEDNEEDEAARRARSRLLRRRPR